MKQGLQDQGLITSKDRDFQICSGNEEVLPRVEAAEE
jgi:hypothetical protein